MIRLFTIGRREKLSHVATKRDIAPTIFFDRPNRVEAFNQVDENGGAISIFSSKSRGNDIIAPLRTPKREYYINHSVVYDMAKRFGE